MPGPRDLLPLVGLIGLTGALVLGLIYDPDPIDLAHFGGPISGTDTPAPRIEAGALLGGVVTDAEGTPLPEALVAVENGARLVFTHADEGGRFRLEGVPRAPFEALVLAYGHQPARLAVQGPRLDAQLVLEVPFDAPPSMGHSLAEDLVGIVPLPVFLRGQDPSLEVWLEPTEFPDAVDPAMRIPRRVSVDGDGNFTILGLAHGTYRAHLLPTWARNGSWPDLLDPREDRELEHPARAPWVLRPCEGALEIQVVREGVPHEGVVVSVVRTRDGRSYPWPITYSGPDGKCFLRPLPEGHYRVELRAGTLRQDREFDLAEGERRSMGPIDLAPADAADGQ